MFAAVDVTVGRSSEDVDVSLLAGNGLLPALTNLVGGRGYP